MPVATELERIKADLEGKILSHTTGKESVSSGILAQYADVVLALGADDTGSPPTVPPPPPNANDPILGQSKEYVEHRLALEVEADKLTDLQAVAASGSTVLIPAPGAGLRLVVIAIKAQNTTDNPTLCVFLSDTVFLDFIQTVSQGTGQIDNLDQAAWYRLPENEAFSVNQSTADLHFYRCIYFVQDITTGLVA